MEKQNVVHIQVKGKQIVLEVRLCAPRLPLSASSYAFWKMFPAWVFVVSLENSRFTALTHSGHSHPVGFTTKEPTRMDVHTTGDIWFEAFAFFRRSSS